MRHSKADHDTAATPECRRSNLANLAAVRFHWTEAVEWAREQDACRAAEQRRFAESRALLELERLWTLPAWKPSAAGQVERPPAARTP